MPFTFFNPSDKSPTVVLSGSNLTATASAGGDSGARATEFKPTGKYYFEVTCVSVSGGDTGLGIANAAAVFSGGSHPLGFDATNGAQVFVSSNIWINGSNLGFGLPSNLANGNVIGVAVDLAANRIWFSNNGTTWNNQVIGVANPAAGIGGKDISAINTGSGLTPSVSFTNSGNSFTGNFGDTTFAYSVPASFTAGWPVGLGGAPDVIGYVESEL